MSRRGGFDRGLDFTGFDVVSWISGMGFLDGGLDLIFRFDILRLV